MTDPRARFPVLERLEARLHRLRRGAIRRVAARGLIEALCAQLFLLPLAGLLAARHPLDPLGLQLALATYAVYLWPPLRLLAARRRGAFGIEAVATEADRLNPEAPDVHRTLLSRSRHSAETLRALDALYAPWEPRLRDPRAPVFTRARGLWLAGAALFATAAPFLAGYAGAYEGKAREVFTRMAFPLAAWRAIPAPRLIPLNLPSQVLRGDSLIVLVRTEHVARARAVYAHVIRATGETRHAWIRGEGAGDTARFTVGPFDREFDLRFSTTGFNSRVYRIRVIDPPHLRSLGARVIPPTYTGLPAESFPDMPTLLTVLPGTRIVWTARASAPLQDLSARFEAGDLEARPADGNRAFTFVQRVTRAGSLRLRLFGAGAETEEGPYRIELKADEAPEISLLSPSKDEDMGRTFKVPVLFRARDDFGVARVRLAYAVRRDDGRDEAGGTLDVTRWRNPRDGAGGGIWDAAALGLQAGDAVELWLEATDNDAVSGPKTSRTGRVRLRVPSKDEVRAAVEAGTRDAAVSLSSALEREKRQQRETRRPDQGASAEAAIPMMNEWEIRRVLSDQPRQTLQEVQRQLEAEIRQAEKAGVEARALKPLREARAEAAAQEKRLPPPEIARAPLAQQKKSLEALNADQKALDQKLGRTPPPPGRDNAPENVQREARAQAENRKEVEESLRRNLEEQKDLKAWLAEKERTAGTRQKRSEQSARNEAQQEQDLQRALEQIDEAMQKGAENGTLSPETLEKMERIRELIEEVLDEQEKESLRESARGPVDAGDLERAMRDLMEKKDGLKESLESAIRMLETLRETRALRDLAADVRELGDAQKDLAAEIPQGDLSKLAERQEKLNAQMDAALKEADRLARQPSLKDLNEPKAREARSRAKNSMQKAEEKLKAPSPDRKTAQQGADLAARQLRKMAEELDKKAAAAGEKSSQAEIRATLEETLDFTRWLAERRDAPDAESAARVARWLRGRYDRIADAGPFAADVLRRESAALGFQADALATAPSREVFDGLRTHAQRAARELFKLLEQEEEGGGSEEGDGEGDGGGGGGAQGQSGEEGLSGRMKGAAGKQSAVNQATQELLRSFLQGRQGASQGQGKDPGSSPGRGAQNLPGSSQGNGTGMNASGGNGNTPGNTPGDAPGNAGEGSGNGEGGNRPGEGEEASLQGAANAQQQIGESLEQMAEGAGDAGGAARKLRQLAEEARELEEALRRGRLDPAEIQRRQERFQTRLLEAANALEERGQQRERRAEAWRGGALPAPEAADAASDAATVRELKRRRDEARKLPLPPAQKRRLEWYYEQLLAP